MKNGVIIANAKTLLSITIFTTLATLSFCLTQFGITDTFFVETSFIWSIVFFLLTLVLLNAYKVSYNEKLIIICALLVRILILVIDSQNDIVGSILHVRDYSVFEIVSKAYYSGDYSAKVTNYPYIVNFIYHIVGCNVYIARLLNAFLSIWAICYTTDILHLLQIKKQYRKIVLLLMSFAPYNMVYSVLLMRESIYLLCLTGSFYSFLKWKIEGDDLFVYKAIIWTLPAAFLHSGYMIFLGIIGFYYLFDKTKYNYRRVWIFFFRATIAFILIIAVSQFDSLRYIVRTGESGLLAPIQRTYRQHFNMGGGSQYLRWMRINNILQVFIYTPIRVFFFLTSPFILDWRGIIDLLSFLMDGVFHLYVLTITIHCLFRNRRITGNKTSKEIEIIIWGGIFVLLTAVMFCWGTTTSGAAIRHRNCLFGIECTILACAFQYLNRQNNISKRPVEL